MERNFTYNCSAQEDFNSQMIYKYRIEFKSRECITAEDFNMALSNLEAEAEAQRKGYN